MICKWVGKENNAAVKATEDVNSIFCNMDENNEIIKIWKHNIKYLRNIENYLIYNYLKLKLCNNDNIIIQYPLYCISPINYHKYFKLPHKQIIAFVQDIESYRYCPNDEDKLRDEIEILKQFDVIIAHNKPMVEFLKLQGIEAKFVDWEVCDYLISKPPFRKINNFTYSICYVGDIKRSEFLRNENSLFTFTLNLYGKLEDSSLLGNNQIYKGQYNPQKENLRLEGDFGLIWEGSSIDTCDGIFGNYMRINNPNRLSLYLANNIPVIIWKNAALSSFVEKNKIGFSIDSLSEIDDVLSNMSLEEYEDILENTKRIGERIRTGYYTKKAILKSLISKC